MNVLKEYDTLAEVSIEEFLSKFEVARQGFFELEKKEKYKHRFIVVATNGEEYSLKTKSHRYHTFYKDLNCVQCGLKGSHFLIQKTKGKDERPHANLYSEDGKLMTKDHIIRKSEGGRNHTDNLQTMCFTCNCVDKQ